MTPYAALLSHFREILAVEQVVGLLHWDQETVMPKAGTLVRGAEVAALEAVLHDKRNDPRIADWLAAVADGAEPVARAQVREIKRQVHRAKLIPKALVTELAELTSVAQHEWVEARRARTFAGSS